MVPGPRGRHAAWMAFNSVVSSVPAARQVFVYRRGFAIPNNHVCVHSIFYLTFAYLLQSSHFMKIGIFVAF